MRGILCSTAMMMVTGLAWTPGASVAQGFSGESSLSFAAGASLWGEVRVGLAHRTTSLHPRTPAPVAEVFHGVGVGGRYHGDSYTRYDDFGPRCGWYGGDYLHGWIDPYEYSVHRCPRRVSRWGLAISFGFGWHYPAYYRPWFVWHDPFWSPWHSFDPWFGGGWLAFGWGGPGYHFGYFRPVYHGYPVYYGSSRHAYATWPRYRRGGSVVYGSGYRAHAPAPTVRYKESPRGRAVARTARAAPRTAVARGNRRPTAAVSGGEARRAGVTARTRVVRPEPRSSVAARPRGTGASDGAVRPRTRTVTPRVQPRASSPRVQPRTSTPPGVRARPTPTPRVQPRASSPRVQPRTSAPPGVRARPTPTPRVQPRTSSPRVQPRTSTAPDVRVRPAPAPRVQPRTSSPRVQPRASTAPGVRARPTPAPRASGRPARPNRRPPAKP